MYKNLFNSLAVNKKLTASFKNMKGKAWDMPIKNLTRKTTIAKEFRTAKSSMEKAVGFMFSEPKTALVMAFEKEKNISLHMFFVFGTIDVLFLDREKRIRFGKRAKEIFDERFTKARVLEAYEKVYKEIQWERARKS